MEQNGSEAGSAPDEPEDVASLKKLLSQLREREQQLCREKEEMEADFGQKRAKFMELFLQKEEELKKEHEKLEEALKDKDLLEDNAKKLQGELDDSRSLITVAEYQKENEIETEKQKCQEEIASLQHIMKEAVQEAVRSVSGRYEAEISKQKKISEKLEAELMELKSQQANEREGVLAAVTKSLKQKVGGLSPHAFVSSGDSVENLEESMRKAQEDAEMLRSLVVPLEEEIKALKDKLRAMDGQLHMYETAFSSLVKGLGSDSLAQMFKGKSPAEVIGHLDEKFTSLCQGLQAEKASRSDLEMYVAVLNTQKAVMQEDMDRLKKELQEIYQLLEKEKREHSNLKRTWQMANDQFLEAQRLQIRDMQRIQGVLTMEQQRQLSETKRKEEERVQHDQAVAWLQHVRNRSSSSILDIDKDALSATPNPSPAKSPLRSVSPLLSRRFKTTDQKLANLSECSLPYSNKVKSSPADLSLSGLRVVMSKRKLHRSLSSSDIHALTRADGDYRPDEVYAETRSLIGVDDRAFTNSPKPSSGLTHDQFKALSDMTPEIEARKSLLEAARSDTESLSLVGKRLVSDKEWQLLEEELKRAREKLGQPCEMCINYEFTLQQVQGEVEKHKKEATTLQQTLNRYKEDLRKEQVFRQELEQKFSDSAADSEQQVREAHKQLQESQSQLSELRQAFAACSTEVYEKLRQLASQRDELCSYTEKLQDENNHLLGRYIAKSQQILSEDIDLPDNAEDLQFHYLKLHEEFIQTLVAKERLEENLKSEILFLKHQVMSEQNLKETLEDTLTQEADNLREQLGILESIKKQLEDERLIRIDKEKCLKKCEADLAQLVTETQQKVQGLEIHVDQLSSIKAKSEEEIQHLKIKIQGLQSDLDNSEAVQRDFVKLSQSLQVELEKIRQSDSEVRWQHDDDVNECNSCKKALHSKKEKHHCNHCGKIFCIECTSKIVHSGPKRRPFHVCNVCHTLLDHETAPYFSCEPPQTPS